MRSISHPIFVAALVTMAALAAYAETTPLREQLDAPLLFVKRHSYQGIHIYDTYYKWRPGGGIYVLENPWDPPGQHRVRPVIDPNTPETLGEGIYSEPELSWDATHLLFCFKGEENGSTSIYEIGVDGTGLRRLTNPLVCADSNGRFSSQHDVCPAYLPDGRIVFKTTRPNGLVPCNNTGVDILHVMDADGGNLQRISVNNVNEFDPCVLPDGRILHGRWEYVDKTALTQQSLWTIFADGAFETALYANNLVRPEAFLDARPIPGAPHLVVSTLARHNAPPRGSIGIVNTRVSKNAPDALFNFEHPDNPTVDTGNSCEPWPLSEDVVLFSGRPEGEERNVIEIVQRDGRREIVHADPEICCHAPMPIKPRALPPRIPSTIEARATAGRFYVQNIYEGLDGVAPGEVKKLRVIEECSRTSPSPGGGGPYNQTFLVSAALAFGAKNFLGVVPVEEDGSAYFEAPAGRAIYLQALDADNRLVQSMRTFVQAAPGMTRSCIGCHERKFDAPRNSGIRAAHTRKPDRLQPESWGTGYVDYPSMVQPILDKHCVRCHGGEDGFAAKLDLSGGWTEHFNISYENLVSRRETQMVASLIAGIDCMNGTAHWSAQIFGPREHGSGAAPLASVIVGGHHNRIPDLTPRERDLLLAWIDTNGLYYGTWDYTKEGPQLRAWPATRDALVGAMRDAGCTQCHERGRHVQFENDWFNLRNPESSRILRAPMAKSKDGNGLALCRKKKTDPRRKRIRLLVGGGYAHAVQPLEHYIEQGRQPAPDDKRAPRAISFESTDDPHYQRMLEIIRKGRRDALVTPRIDMPNAEVIAGHSRHFLRPALPDPLPDLDAKLLTDGLVQLSWESSARTIGLIGEVYRSDTPGFAPTPDTLIAQTESFRLVDKEAAPGIQHYALVLLSDAERSAPVRASIEVPPPAKPEPAVALAADQGFRSIALAWQEQSDTPLRYHVYRAPKGTDDFERLTDAPTPELAYHDAKVAPEAEYRYTVRAVSRRGRKSPFTRPVLVQAPAPIDRPVLAALFTEDVNAHDHEGAVIAATCHGNAQVAGGALDLTQGGHVTYEHRPGFDLSGAFTIECEVKLLSGDMPVLISCGAWGGSGWFLQRLGAGWRWYVGGINCDGGEPVPGDWTHLLATFDGATARLYQDGKLVAEKRGAANMTPYAGPLTIGQYSAPADHYQPNGYLRRVMVYQRIPPALDQQLARAWP